MIGISFNRKEVNPLDIISGIETMPLNYAITCNWLEDNWIPSEEYLEWAKRAISENDEYGFDIAINYSKKSVCRRIDALVLYNHLNNIFRNRRSYPDKINILKAIGLTSFKIVHKCVIEPRNDLEHLYQKATKEKAEDSIQVAELFLNATQSEFERGSILIVDSSILFGQYHSNPLNFYGNFCGFSDNPMLVVDILRDEIKIVFSKEKEIVFVKIKSFSNSEEIEFSNRLRKHYKELQGRTDKISEQTFKILLKESAI